MLAAALSAVNENNAASRGLAKVLRAEAKRHNNAKAAAAFAAAGGAAAAVSAVSELCFLDDPTGHAALSPSLPPERINAATDNVAALADLAAAGGAAQTAVIEAGASARVKAVLAHHNGQNKFVRLYIQVCRLAGNLCFGGAYNFGGAYHLFGNVVVFADDATSFRWAAHVIWNACTHLEIARANLHRCRNDTGGVVEALVRGAMRFPGVPRAYGLRAIAYVVLGSE